MGGNLIREGEGEGQVHLESLCGAQGAEDIIGKSETFFLEARIF